MKVSGGSPSLMEVVDMMVALVKFVLQQIYINIKIKQIEIFCSFKIGCYFTAN